MSHNIMKDTYFQQISIHRYIILKNRKYKILKFNDYQKSMFKIRKNKINFFLILKCSKEMEPVKKIELNINNVKNRQIY